MGAEREDAEPTSNRLGTEPGLGRSSSGHPSAVAPGAADDEAPPPVDFDALHAALGDPLEYDELPSGPALEHATGEADDLLDNLEPAHDMHGGHSARPPRGGESSGRSSATYSSARPHTIPPTRVPNEDPNAPAVIVASDDTVPSAPPAMTVPLAHTPHGPAFGGGPAMGRGSNPAMRGAMPGHPSSGAQPLASGYPHAPPSHAPPSHAPPGHAPPGHAPPGHAPHAAHMHAAHTPPPFPVQPRGVAQMTMRMPERPINPRRQKTATVVVRPRGPSAKQKLVAFMAMLLLVTACGIAVIIWRKPRWIGLEPRVDPVAAAAAVPTPVAVTSPTPSGATAVSPAPGSSGALAAAASGSAAAAPATGSATAPGLASGTPAPSASVKKAPKPAAPPPHPSALR